jgi:hypothetical protein
MAIVIKDIEGAKEPVTLEAPVVLDATDPAQADELLQFIDVLKWSRVTDVADAEATRLSENGYFDALSAYARGAIAQDDGPLLPAEMDIEGARKFLESKKIEYKEADGFLKVDAPISVHGMGLTRLPDLRAIKTSAYFECSQNRLASLEGMPSECAYVLCQKNLLRDFSGLPESVTHVESDFGDFWARHKIPPNLLRRRSATEAAGEVAPDRIQQIFKDAAAVTRSALISEVVILPSNIYHSPKTESMFRGERFDVPYRTAFGGFKFGFFQVSDKTGRQNSTFATFTIDSETIAPLLPQGAQKMFADLQSVMTLVNHDMLHHLTSPILTPTVSDKHDQKLVYGLPVHAWGDNVRRYGWGGSTEAYEDLVQITQEHVVLQGDPKGKKTTAIVDSYFDELTRLRDGALKAATSYDAKDDVRSAVNYCALLMGHALLRVYPLNHPVMTSCLDRMLAVDPAPEKTLDDTCLNYTVFSREDRKKVLETLSVKPVEFKIKDTFEALRPSLDVLRHYGFDVRMTEAKKESAQPPAEYADTDEGRAQAVSDRYNRAATDWKNKPGYGPSPRFLKLLQLTDVSMADVMAHVPQSKLENISALQRDAAKLTLGMIQSMDATLRVLAPLKPK